MGSTVLPRRIGQAVQTVALVIGVPALQRAHRDAVMRSQVHPRDPVLDVRAQHLPAVQRTTRHGYPPALAVGRLPATGSFPKAR